MSSAKPTRHRGTAHHKSKLDWEAVRFIREHTELNNAELARQYGVTRATIRSIRENVTWHDPEYQVRENPFRGAGYKPGMRPVDL